MTVEDRLSAIEESLKWVREWTEFFVRAYYQVDSLEQVAEAQRVLETQLRPLPETGPDRFVI